VADEDWRVTVTLPGHDDVKHVIRSVREQEVKDDVLRRLGQRVAVSSEGPDIFLYTGTGEAAREAEQVVREVLAGRDLTATFATDRWHPIEEEWENAAAPLPQTPQQREAEHERRMADETQESLATGKAEWEVIVTAPSHRAAVELAGRLQDEGRTVIRRWKYLFLGANDEDDAADLARAIRQEIPDGVSVTSEPLAFTHYARGWDGGVRLYPDADPEPDAGR